MQSSVVGFSNPETLGNQIKCMLFCCYLESNKVKINMFSLILWSLENQSASKKLFSVGWLAAISLEPVTISAHPFYIEGCLLSGVTLYKAPTSAT